VGQAPIAARLPAGIKQGAAALTGSVQATAAIIQRWAQRQAQVRGLPRTGFTDGAPGGASPTAARLPAGIKQGAVALTDGMQAIAAIIQRWAQRHA